MISVESDIYIDAPRERVFELLVHPERMANEMESVLEVKVLSRDANMILSETRASANGRDTVFVLEAYLFPPERLKIHQIRGELRRLEGEDVLEPEGAGTRVTEKLQFDVGVPLFGDLLGKMGIQQTIEGQSRERLQVLKRLAESGQAPEARQSGQAGKAPKAGGSPKTGGVTAAGETAESPQLAQAEELEA